ncbi:TPA: Gp15 family bacteriophage protein [Streptococcus suis]
MIDLSRGFEDNLEIGDEKYPLNLSFDNVLRLLEMLHDESVPSIVRPYLALKMLLKYENQTDEKHVDDLLSSLEVETAVDVFKAISDEYIVIKSAKAQAPIYDLAGNLITRKPVKEEEDEDREIYYSLKYDGDYIYSSFLQAYQIDLIEVQGILHWQKFYALLNGLPSDTKFAEVIKIRTWEEQKGDSPEYKEKMRQLQDEYALPEFIDY